ncbi:MAG: hypothetical protein R3Y50_05300 [Rikenellaceae bacterium]
MYKFYIKNGDSTYGPFSTKEILALSLKPNALVTEDNLNGKWMPASELDFEGMYANECAATQADRHIEQQIDSCKIEPKEPSSTYKDVEQVNKNRDEVPEQIKKWNWGAFLCGWIWAVFNGIYWPLLMIVLGLIPYIGWGLVLGLSISLGRQGNEWAWKAGNWNDAEEFLKSQEKWITVGVILFVITFVIGFICSISYFE